MKRLPAYACAACLAAAPAAAADCADLALVLAVDASASVDAAEYHLQTAGLAAAFRDPRVREALAQAGAVKVAAVFWGDPATPVAVLGWDTIREAADADAFAARLERHARSVTGDTGIGGGLAVALDLLAGGCAGRMVIDVSGDGRESREPRGRPKTSLAAARSRAADMGVVVNGLAIESEDVRLGAYYRETVITGPGAFAIAVRGFADFGAAIRRKLAREIAPPAVAALRPDPATR